jgi:CheY-like chemotaxis protein
MKENRLGIVMRRKILVVEDDFSFLRMMQLLLKRQGYEVEAVSGVSDARKKLGDSGNGFDLIILDLMMPEENGFDFLKWRDNAGPSIRDIPVLLNTAKRISEDEDAFLRVRVKDVVDKGLNFTEAIIKKVAEALS